MAQTRRHKVFISFHHEDQVYKDRFAGMMEGYIVDRSVEDGDIDDLNLRTETIRQKIRDDFIADATVTVVLVGPCTWQRKHVDWEIGSSLRHTAKNPRCGLLGILLPTHPDYGRGRYDPRRLPPRLADNCGEDGSYAGIFHWPNRPPTHHVHKWIHDAFERRDSLLPNNSRKQFKRNRSGDCSKGWES